MRSPAEINQAISYLKGKGGKAAEEQIKVLEAQMSESQVFNAYVVNVGEANKDEALYFAAREAAQYLSGIIEIEDLIPEYETIVPVPVVTKELKADTITVDSKVLNALLQRLDDQEKRIKQLEKWTGKKRTASRREPAPLPIGADINKMLNQRQACAYARIGKNTLKKYADKGFITGYQYGRNVYYAKADLDNLKKDC